MTTEPWVSVEDVAKHLGVAKDSVYRWIEGTDNDWWLPEKIRSPLKLNRITSEVLKSHLKNASYQAGQVWTEGLLFLSATTDRAALKEAERQETNAFLRMVFWQEELDWEVYRLFGLTPQGATALVGPEGPSRQLIEDWKKRFPPPTSRASGAKRGAKKAAVRDEEDSETEEDEP